MTSEEKQIQEFNSLRNIPDSFKKIGFIRLRVLERVQVEELNLNKCTPHSRYFSDELGVQIFWQKTERMFTFWRTYGIL